MKKSLIAILFSIIASISGHAVCINCSFYAYDEGEYYGKIVLTDECTCTISTVDGENFSGTYSISEHIEPGEITDITFYLSNGQTVRAKYGWPTQGKKCILLDGFTFEVK